MEEELRAMLDKLNTSQQCSAAATKQTNSFTDKWSFYNSSQD